MLFDDKRRALHRALGGALLGMAGGGLAAWAAGSLIAGSPSALALAFLNCGFPAGWRGGDCPVLRSLRPVRGGGGGGHPTLRRGRLRPGGADAGPLRP